jgi:tetratricopeptide (TPR) repeat protein
MGRAYVYINDVSRILMAAVAVLVAAAGVIIIVRIVKPQPIVLGQADKRPIEARLTFPSADRWRPYDGERAARPGREEVRVDALTALQKRGDWRGLGDAYLLGGEPQRAADALAKAGTGADVESDRAAVALADNDAHAAIAHATRALQMAPGHVQAAWNRTLALRDLGLVRSAAIAFDTIARKGERGWSDEAFKRAIALRAAYQRSERERIDKEHAGTLHHDAARIAAEEKRLRALVATSPAEAERAARTAIDDARAALDDPHDSVRRYLIVAAEAARAGHADAVADAYVDEARLLVPGE